MHHSGSSIAHLPQTSIFWEKSLIFFSSNYKPLSLCKFFKSFLESIKSYEDVLSIFGTKKIHLAKQEFFSEKLLIDLVPFINAYLHSKN